MAFLITADHINTGDDRRVGVVAVSVAGRLAIAIVVGIFVTAWYSAENEFP